MITSIFCICVDQAQAQVITTRLHQSGFTSENISVLFSDDTETRSFAREQDTKTPEDSLTGAGVGAVTGGILGWVIGIGAIIIPGVGPFMAAGPITTLLAGATVGAAVGGIAGGLIGLGIPEHEAKRYEDKIKEGHILISAHTDNSKMIDKANTIFIEEDAEDITITGEISDSERSAKDQAYQSSKKNNKAADLSRQSTVTDL